MARLICLEPQQPGRSTVAKNITWSRKQRKTYHKVKTGCKACKIRRQKCDEQTPICSGCSKHSTQCLYPARKCSWPEKDSSHEKPTAYDPLSFPLSGSLLACPSPELNLTDLELLHQFLTSTCIATAQLPEITARIQTAVPPLAQAHPFVMRGILAMAAIHLSRLRPSRGRHYATIAARNHDAALPHFRLTLQNINSDNCDALICYSKSLVWCSMAGDETSNTTKVASKTEPNWLPSWFYLLRGSCHIVESSKIWIKDGLYNFHTLDRDVDYSNSLDDHRLCTLQTQLLSMTQSATNETVLSALRESFARASMQHQNTPYRNALNYWFGSLSDDYVLLLQKKDTWALVILAHFCVLLHRSETVWFMKGHAARLMSSIVECLDATWYHLIRWPCQEIDVD